MGGWGMIDAISQRREMDDGAIDLSSHTRTFNLRRKQKRELNKLSYQYNPNGFPNDAELSAPSTQ